MKNKELIYELAKKIDMVIEVYKKGEYVGRFKFIDDKLNKLKETKKMSHKEAAVEIYTKFFLRLKNIPYEDRIEKAKIEAIKYVDERIKKSISVPEDHFYWQYLKGYISKIDITYNQNK